MYKGVNELQYKDGRMLLMMNRDDASGFQLDTLTTSKQYANPVVRGMTFLQHEPISLKSTNLLCRPRPITLQLLTPRLKFVWAL